MEKENREGRGVCNKEMEEVGSEGGSRGIEGRRDGLETVV